MTDQATTPTVSEAQKPTDDQRIAAEVVERYKELPISMSEHDQLTRLRGWIADAIGGSAIAAEQFGRQAALRAMPEAQGWRLIESAPNWQKMPNGETLDVWVIGGRFDRPTLVAAEGEYWRADKKKGLRYVPTHWHPHFVPAPPPQEVK